MGSLYIATQEKKLLLKQVQFPTFKGEGPNIERDAEAWLDAMDDYFLAAGLALENQTMLGMFRLTGDAKHWWKQHYRDNPSSSPSWEGTKQAVKERYLPPAHQALRMNEFYALRQLGLTLEEYYSKFVSLRRYAPQMTMEQQIARFYQGLNRPLSTRLEAMRPTSIQDALIKAKPLTMEAFLIYTTMNISNGDISGIGVPKGKIVELLPGPHLNPLKQIRGIIKEEEGMEFVAEEEE
ncbi:hypothetical protein L7F22_051871 [Adiantum nelumboides]|nr:hypothetical protein [Adiantum nelumboides]